MHLTIGAAILPDGRGGNPAAYAEACARWRARVERHAEDTRVLANAARVLLRREDGFQGAVATYVVHNASSWARAESGIWDFPALRALAAALVARAQALDPANQKWQDLLTGVENIPEFSRPAEAARPRVRVDAGVAASRLPHAPKPVYPPEAREARIHGTVRLNVHIGADGRVLEVRAMSGHPLLVKAAETAVRQYVYLPFTLIGQGPAEAITTVDVMF